MAKKPKKKSSGSWISEEDMWDSTLSSDEEEYLLDMDPIAKADAFSGEVPVDDEEEVFEDADEVWDDALSLAAEKMEKEKQQLKSSTSQLRKKQEQLKKVSLNSGTPAKAGQKKSQQQTEAQEDFEEKARQTQEIKLKLKRKREAELQKIKQKEQQKRKARPQTVAEERNVFDDSEGKAGSRKVLIIMGGIVLIFIGVGLYAAKDTLFEKDYEFKSDKYADVLKDKKSKPKTKARKTSKPRVTPQQSDSSSQLTANETMANEAMTEGSAELAGEPLEADEQTVESPGTLASVMEAKSPNATATPGKLTDAEIQVALDESVIRMGEKDWQAVIDLSGRIIKSNAFVSNAFINRSVAYTELGMYKEAIQDCDLVIATEPDNGIAYNNRGYAYEKMDKLLKAVVDYEKACSLGIGASCVEAQNLSSKIEE